MFEKKEHYKFPDLLDIMAILRGPNGCSWDKEQSFESILNCLIEEAYEYFDAVILKDKSNMQEELGDLLLQVVFHSQMAKEKQWFSIEEVIHGICYKLVQRHPHVFESNNGAMNSSQVMAQWEEIKKKEKPLREESSIFNSIPTHLSPLLKSLKIQKKAGDTGFDWKDYRGPLNKIKEEIQELEEAVENSSNIEEEFGDVLFAMVNLSKHLKINPELSLQKANHKFVTRFEKMKLFVEEDNKNFSEMTLDTMDIYWDKAKNSLKKLDSYET